MPSSLGAPFGSKRACATTPPFHRPPTADCATAISFAGETPRPPSRDRCPDPPARVSREGNNLRVTLAAPADAVAVHAALSAWCITEAAPHPPRRSARPRGSGGGHAAQLFSSATRRHGGAAAHRMARCASTGGLCSPAPPCSTTSSSTNWHTSNTATTAPGSGPRSPASSRMSPRSAANSASRARRCGSRRPHPARLPPRKRSCHAEPPRNGKRTDHARPVRRTHRPRLLYSDAAVDGLTGEQSATPGEASPTRSAGTSGTSSARSTTSSTSSSSASSRSGCAGFDVAGASPRGPGHRPGPETPIRSVPSAGGSTATREPLQTPSFRASRQWTRTISAPCKPSVHGANLTDGSHWPRPHWTRQRPSWPRLLARTLFGRKGLPYSARVSQPDL